MSDQLGNYVVKLLDKVNGNDELNTILNVDDHQRGQMFHHGSLARLQLAIEYKEKRVSVTTKCFSTHT